MSTLLAAVALTGRLSFNTLPPGGYGLAAEVVKAPWIMRIDTTYMLSDTANRGVWAVTLAYPLWHLGEIEIGPLVGLNGSLPGTPARPKEVVLLGAAGPSATVGACVRWQGERWWATACPSVGLTGFTSSGWGPGLLLPLDGCPPLLEVGYQLTPALGLQVRASALPIGASWKF